MVRILHTADWHLGQTLAGFTREVEHAAALDALVAIATEEAVDAIVVAGDVFDTLNPSADAQALYFRTLARLRSARPDAAIVVVSGNHDPAGRLEAPRDLYALVGVSVVGTVVHARGGVAIERHLVPIRDAAGETRAHVLAVPFPRATDLPALDMGTVEGSPVVAGVRALYSGMIAAARARIGGAPLLVTGHLHVAGGLESEGAERRILVGGEHAVPPDVFAGADYVALGHLHKPQGIGRETVRYAGSLFPLSKTEIGYDHGVTIVEIGADGAMGQRHRPIPRPVANIALGPLAPSEIEGALEALALDPAMPPTARPFLYLTVRIEGPATGLQAEIGEIVERFPVRLVAITLERAADAPGAAAEPVVVRLAERAPTDVFREAFRAKHGGDPTPEHEAAFASLLVEPEEA